MSNKVIKLEQTSNHADKCLIIFQQKCYVQMTIIVISSSLRLAITVILGDFERPLCNNHYIHFSAGKQPDITFANAQLS